MASDMTFPTPPTAEQEGDPSSEAGSDQPAAPLGSPSHDPHEGAPWQKLDERMKEVNEDIEASIGQMKADSAVMINTPANNYRDNSTLRQTRSITAQGRPVDSEDSAAAKNAGKTAKCNGEERPEDSKRPTVDNEAAGTQRKRPKLKINFRRRPKPTSVGQHASMNDPYSMGGPLDTSNVGLREPPPQPLLPAEESAQNSLESTESPLALSSSTSLSSIASTIEEQVNKGAIGQHTASCAMVLKEEAPQKPTKRARVEERSKIVPRGHAAKTEALEGFEYNTRSKKRKIAQQKETGKKAREMEMYTPNIDPSSGAKDDIHLPSPFELAKTMYIETSCANAERKLGETFPQAGPTPSKSLNVDWPKDTENDHTKEMEAWAKREQRWEKTGVPARHRALWSNQPAPRNIKQFNTYVSRHGRTRRAASQRHLPDDRPLQRPGYVTEYTKMTKEVMQLQERFEIHRGALRVDHEDSDSFERNMKEHMAVKGFNDKGLFDYEEDFDHEFDFNDEGNAEDKEHHLHAESYVERMLRIKSHPPNDTIEYEDRIDPEHDGSIKEPTPAMMRGDFSGASVPSERWYFNKDSRRTFPEFSINKIAKDSNKLAKEKAESQLAAIALLELRHTFPKGSSNQIAKEKAESQLAAIALLELRHTFPEGSSNQIAKEKAESQLAAMTLLELRHDLNRAV